MGLTEKQLAEWKKYHGEQEFKIGKQYYKSGWLTKAPETALGRSHKRWFQLRHWMLFYFPDEQDGWNYPEWGPDYKHEEEDQSNLCSFPGLDISLPSFKLPDMSMPDLSMPDISMPDVSMPSMSMPSIDMKAPKMPKRKERYEHGPYGSITIYTGAQIKRDGKTITLTKASQLKIFKGSNEEKKDRTFKLTAEDDEEAESWYKSMVWGGAREA